MMSDPHRRDALRGNRWSHRAWVLDAFTRFLHRLPGTFSNLSWPRGMPHHLPNYIFPPNWINQAYLPGSILRNRQGMHLRDTQNYVPYIITRARNIRKRYHLQEFFLWYHKGDTIKNTFWVPTSTVRPCHRQMVTDEAKSCAEVCCYRRWR